MSCGTNISTVSLVSTPGVGQFLQPEGVVSPWEGRLHHSGGGRDILSHVFRHRDVWELILFYVFTIHVDVNLQQ